MGHCKRNLLRCAQAVLRTQPFLGDVYFVSLRESGPYMGKEVEVIGGHVAEKAGYIAEEEGYMAHNQHFKLVCG